MKYFTLENLNDFLKWMENTKPFSSYEVTRRDAGLELFKIENSIKI